MQLKIVKSEGLAHNSYFLSDEGEALVVDPRRDCSIYTELAKRECSVIEYILETHRNEDYVIGSVELQNMTDAEIAHSKETPFKYGEHNLSDGDVLNIGNLRIRALYTPGHTNDSVCYAVYESTRSTNAMMVFSGDTLFVGEVGRTDLLGHDLCQVQSEKLYDSIHEKILPLGDQVILYPAHGTGSICGDSISERVISTIGYERKTNQLLDMGKSSFVEHMLKLKLLRPPYFGQMEQYNLSGPPLLCEAVIPQPLNVKEFEEEIHQPTTVIVDTREPGAFASSHIPGSLNIWLDGLSYYPGWTLTYDQRILFVMERKEDIETAEAYLRRIGFDNTVGYLCQGIKGWRNSGRAIGSLGTLSAAGLKERLERNEITLLDVREEYEWNDGHIEGAKMIYVGHLKEDADRLPRDKPMAIICASGDRGSLGASILRNRGFESVCNVLGGMNAWESSGYPVIKG